MLYLFQDDIGLPLIQDGYAVGILVRLLPDRLTVFTNIKKYVEDIIEMMEERRMKYTETLPRRRARYDHKSAKDNSNRKRKISSQ